METNASKSTKKKLFACHELDELIHLLENQLYLCTLNKKNKNRVYYQTPGNHNLCSSHGSFLKCFIAPTYLLKINSIKPYSYPSVWHWQVFKVAASLHPFPIRGTSAKQLWVLNVSPVPYKQGIPNCFTLMYYVYLQLHKPVPLYSLSVLTELELLILWLTSGSIVTHS